MEFREGVGRMVVAARDISSNEIVLVEDPVALSPTQVKNPYSSTHGIFALPYWVCLLMGFYSNFQGVYRIGENLFVFFLTISYIHKCMFMVGIIAPIAQTVFI